MRGIGRNGEKGGGGKIRGGKKKNQIKTSLLIIEPRTLESWA